MKNSGRTPNRISVTGARIWANKRLKEGTSGLGIRNFTRRAAAAFVREGLAPNLRAGKVLAREMFARAEVLLAAKISRRTPSQRAAA